MITVRSKSESGVVLKKRMCIIADSLGIARSEDGIKVTDTWTNKLIEKYSGSFNIYTLIKHGLSVKMNLIEEAVQYKPDIVVCQVGVVDACRRPLKSRENWICDHLGAVGKVVRKYTRKHHFELTKKRNIHITDIDTFKAGIARLSQNGEIKVIFIAIAPPGDFLLNEAYNVKEDIEEYNQNIRELTNDRFLFVDPYEGEDIEKYQLKNDGHHLTVYGNRIVYEKVCSAIESFL